MKRYLIYLFTLTSTLLIGYDSFRDMSGAAEVNPIIVNIYLDVTAENISTLKDLTVRFDNCDGDLHYVKEITDNSVRVDGIIPGVYSVTVSGTAIDTENNEYYIDSNSVNTALFRHGSALNIEVQRLKVSPLISEEIHYCGSRSEKRGVYFRDQFYKIYSNSADILYLDGICFANLTPGTATTKLPIWPKVDGNNCACGERVWKFPGNETEYPLAPGESCIVFQFTANHQLDIYDPQSSIDGSGSEFEFNMNNPSFPDQATYDMQHVFYQGKARMGSIPQYLTSVFGGTYVIFRVPGGEAWDPVNDENMKTTGLSKPNSNVYYAEIPIKCVLDAIETVNDESKINAKRVPGVLDAGIAWARATYCGLGVAHKLSIDEEGSPIICEETGIYIYQDASNGTGGFERNVIPVMRRNGAKMPLWNHTL